MVGGEVHVLDTEMGTLEQAEPSAIQQNGHQSGSVLELVDDGADLVPGEHHGKSLASFRADHVVEPW